MSQDFTIWKNEWECAAVKPRKARYYNEDTYAFVVSSRIDKLDDICDCVLIQEREWYDEKKEIEAAVKQ